MLHTCYCNGARTYTHILAPALHAQTRNTHFFICVCVFVRVHLFEFILAYTHEKQRLHVRGIITHVSRTHTFTHVHKNTQTAARTQVGAAQVIHSNTHTHTQSLAAHTHVSAQTRTLARSLVVVVARTRTTVATDATKRSAHDTRTQSTVRSRFALRTASRPRVCV